MAEVGKDITEYLKEFHTTEGKAIKARELCVLFNVHQKQLRNIVSDLRQNGEAICSSTYGYWYSRDPDDISTTLSRLVGQVDNMQKIKNKNVVILDDIYITETPQAEKTEPVTETEQEAKLEHDLNYTYPYNTMSADWGSEVYEDGFRYYEIQQEYKDAGGCFPEIVQVYLWC